MMRRAPSRVGFAAGRALFAGAVLLLLHASAPALVPPALADAVRQEILPNGLRVLLLENHSRPLIGVCIVVNGGSRTETPDLSGLSHYYEHLIFRGGSAKQAELEFRKEMQRIGEESGGYTTNDYTCYGFTAPVEHFEEALGRSVDAWMNLRLTAQKVAKERQVVMEEYNQGEDRPDYKVYYQIERLMFHDHPYKRDTIGRKEVIEGASLATFRTFYEERYVPNQMTLAVVGDFDSDAMRGTIAKAFAPYKRGRASFEQGLAEKPQTAFRMGVERMKTPSTRFYLGFHVPPYSDPQAPAFSVLASLLGRGTSSRLYRALKERENVVTTVDVDFEIRKDPGMFLVGAELPPQNEAKAFGLIRGELRRLAEEPVPADELARVKSALLNRYALAAQTVFDRAERLCLFALMSDVSLEGSWPKLLSSVTAEDIQQLARATFAAEQASYSVVRPERTEGPSEDSIQSMVRDWASGWPGGAGTARAGASLPPRREVLPNGVTLILREIHSTPIVAVSTMARGGQWIEPEGRYGVSHMAAVLLRRGAGSLSAREISERADRLGMTVGTFGTPDYAAVSWQAPSRNLDAAWNLYTDILLRPTFPASEIAKVRQDLVEQVKSLGDHPFDYTNLRFGEALYHQAPYRRLVAGDSASLARIQAADLRRAYERMFCGANLVVAVVGDFDAGALLATAKRTL
ncbi:MAG TPA: pitrilysin family protein, partial [Candidatus Eisenbacteria bacterium]